MTPEYDNYIGCKIIKAKKATYGEYKKEKNGDTEFKSNIPPEKEGYIVIYPPIGEGEKPHMSWSPKDIFEKAYRIIDGSELALVLG